MSRVCSDETPADAASDRVSPADSAALVYDQDDVGSPIRGILIGLLLAMPLWGIIVTLGSLVLRRLFSASH